MDYIKHGAQLGIAGTNTRPLRESVLAIAGNQGTTMRREVDFMVTRAIGNRETLGDRVARAGWNRTCFLTDYTYAACTSKHGGMRWRKGYADYFGPDKRTLPLVLDSSAFRDFNGTGENWSSYRRYCEAIDVMQPDAVMARDVIGDQAATLAAYERMLSDGYRDITIPVWQAPQLWNPKLSPTVNGQVAAADPILRGYADRSPLVAIGGLMAKRRKNGSPIVPVLDRAEYLAAICDAFPALRLWGLGQASGVVINGLGQRGLLDRVSADSIWWIQAGKCEQISVVQDGLLKSITLARTGAQSFFTYVELMAENLRALKAAYDGFLSFPGAARVPDDMRDPDQRAELTRRVRKDLDSNQMDFLELLV